MQERDPVGPHDATRDDHRQGLVGGHVDRDQVCRRNDLEIARSGVGSRRHEHRRQFLSGRGLVEGTHGKADRAHVGVGKVDEDHALDIVLLGLQYRDDLLGRRIDHVHERYARQHAFERLEQLLPHDPRCQRPDRIDDPKRKDRPDDVEEGRAREHMFHPGRQKRPDGGREPADPRTAEIGQRIDDELEDHPDRGKRQESEDAGDEFLLDVHGAARLPVLLGACGLTHGVSRSVQRS